MLKNGDIWHAFDCLAVKYGLSTSGLARRAGLDPTTFNKCKRVTKNDKQRWPSTESLAKVLDATGATLAEFVGLIGDDNAGAVAQRIPVIGYAQAATQGFFDETGNPSGTGWDEVLFPRIRDPQAYGLEIGGDSMAPVYRDGDIIVVSPEASLRRGDRVVVKARHGEVMAQQFLRQSARRLELASLNRTHPDRVLDIEEIAWVARIVWVSQ